MDQDRAIRFAIPPFFLLASLLWGAHLGDFDFSAWLLSTGNLTTEKLDFARELLGLLAATAVAIVPVGFLISSLSVFLLRVIALIARRPTYEAVLDNHTLQRIWNQLHNHSHTVNQSQTLYAVVTFDHELLKAGIHRWLLRRWNSFNVAAHSIVALVLAHMNRINTSTAVDKPHLRVCGIEKMGATMPCSFSGIVPSLRQCWLICAL